MLLFLCFNYSITTIYCQRLNLDPLLSNRARIISTINSGNDSLRLVLIAELLNKKGDTKGNHTWFEYTNKMAQQNHNAMQSTTIPRADLGTNQFIALYLISVIYYENIEFCTKIEIEYTDSKNRVCRTTNLKRIFRNKMNGDSYMKYKIVDRKIIANLYGYYKKWYKEAKEKGLKNVPSPLTGTNFTWKGERDSLK